MGLLSNASPKLEYPSPSESRQPKRSTVEFPAVFLHASPWNPENSSPNPSLSESSHWLESLSKTSCESAQPSPSLSGQPYV